MIKEMILATLQDSGPADMMSLEEALHVGEVKLRQLPAELHALVRAGLVHVSMGVYSAVPK